MKLSAIFAAMVLSTMTAADFANGSSCMLDVAKECGTCTICRNEEGDAMRACHKSYNDCVRSFAQYYDVNLDQCVLSGNLCRPE
ncbi:hypothetical protein ARSEF1564_010307 [Beauveria bassiana]